MFGDPRIFNFIILGLYTLNFFWWLYNGQYAQAWYWVSAASITAAVTWGFPH